MSKTFSARYPGECDDCGFAFDEGDLIGYDDSDNLSHARCLDEQNDKMKTGRDDDVF